MIVYPKIIDNIIASIVDDCRLNSLMLKKKKITIIPEIVEDAPTSLLITL